MNIEDIVLQEITKNLNSKDKIIVIVFRNLALKIYREGIIYGYNIQKSSNIVQGCNKAVTHKTDNSKCIEK